ncbi:MAG: hypothetical protein JNG85_15600 [Spirochaetaceae bacterium]|nr:hypothetical protein [Spirochaetaceae bacterium]
MTLPLRLAAIAAILPAFLLGSFLYSLPAYLRQRKTAPVALVLGDGPVRIATIAEAIAWLRGRGLPGLELVREAQRLVAAKMIYSRRNNWDTAERAFASGAGYCQQSAGALLLILRGLDLEARMVQCVRNEFPPRDLHEYRTAGGTCGHAWLRVRVAGEEFDVCPGDPANEPGKIHFRILGRVTPYRGLARVFGHFGSALLNTWWDRRARRAAGLPPAAPRTAAPGATESPPAAPGS